MKRERTIRAFEHDTLRLKRSESDIGLTQKELNLLEIFNEKNKNKFFSLVHKGIKFNSYVGVLKIGHLSIEILPKADKQLSLNSSDAEKNQWRRLLLQMLHRSGTLKLEKLPQADLAIQKYSLLNIFIETYLNEVSRLIHHGLLKQYRRSEGNIKTFKGRLLFGQQIRTNLSHKERFYCNYETYDYSTLINRILHSALNAIATSFSGTEFQSRANKLLFEFPDIATKAINITDFDSSFWTRKNSEFKEVIQLAKLILLNYSPNFQTGSESLMAILFDMNTLWEKFIYRELKSQETLLGYKVFYQEKKLFWENRTIRPDLVIQKDGQNIVLDTKWKIPDAKGPSDEDLKQMYVYNQHWDCDLSLLIYPSANQSSYSTAPFNSTRYCNISQSSVNHATGSVFVSPLNKDRSLWLNSVLKALASSYSTTFFAN